MARIVRNLLGLLAGASLLATVSASPAGAAALTLINGWTNAPFGTRNAAAMNVQGVIHFIGAIATTGTDAEPFVLPKVYRPTANVFVPVDLCNATNGRLQIGSNGVVLVEAEGGTFSNAQCFTSLDGVSFALSPTNYHPLTLRNGWTNAPFGARNAAAQIVNGVVQLQGAIATTGTNAHPFVLPLAYRPTTSVYVPVDLCNANNGRLYIQPTGAVTVEAEGGTFGNAQCFTSLEGVSFAQDAGGFAALALKNGWTNAPFATRNAAVRKSGGVVQFEGAIATTGTNPEPFVLPLAYRPAASVYLPVDLCGATNGRLFIAPTGVVTVEPEGGTFSNAQCFTSLESASFHL